MKRRLANWFSLAAALFVLAVSSGPAEAVLKDVGPSNPANGFPVWYRDTSSNMPGYPQGLPLQQCISQTISPFLVSGGGFMCNLLPETGFIPTNPVVFPTNFPSEIFWWSGDVIINAGDPGNTTGIAAGLTLGLEGAFGGGPVLPGDQVSFARIRLRIDTVVGGNYRVTHPYGVNTFSNVPAGVKAINFTEDIGLGAAGDFKGALNGKLGPFLTWTFDPGPDTPTNPDGTITVGSEVFVGDPNITHTVTGSPFNTNFFRIERLADDGVTVLGMVETDQFSITGKIYTQPIPTPVKVDRATYTRDNTLLQMNVFASAAATSNTGVPSVLSLSGAGLSTTTMLSDNAGKFFLHQEFAPDFVTPGLVTVTNTADNAPVPVDVLLTDEVQITQATYNPVSKVLAISATSSDAIALPALNAVGFGAMNNAGQIFVTNVTTPPATVTVTSAAGGSDTELVRITAQSTNAAPTAVDDAGDVAAGGSTTFNVAANDTDPDPGDSVVPASVTIALQGTHGTATANGDGTVTYTANAGFSGTDTFTYTIQDTHSAISTPATVTMTIIEPAGNVAPVATDDAVTTAEDTAVNISVTANDNDANGNLAPATVTLASQPANGTVVIIASGTVRYTPAPNFSGTNTFTYTVKDSIGAVSNIATVTVTVTPANDPPLAAADSTTTAEDTPVVINVVANDTDVEGGIAPASAAVATAPANGTAVPDGLGGITYTPNPNFFGTDTFTYRVSDGIVASNPATVTVTVTPVNDPPVAGDDVASTVAGVARSINVIANDIDVDGNINPATILIASQPANGTAVANANGTVTFTPAGGFTGPTSFTYNVKDAGNATSNNATVTVNVTAAAAETVTVLRAQYRASTREWLAEGTVTNGTPVNVTIYIGRTIGGTVLGTAPVSGGRWRFSLPGNPANPAPDASNTISVQSSGGGTRLAFPVALR